MKKRCIFLLCLALGCLSLVACGGQGTNATAGNDSGDRLSQVSTDVLQFSTPADDALIAVFDTGEGTFAAVLFPEEAPQAVQNFVTLARQGYYNGIVFHRVIKDFIVQSGDATGTGAGGSSIWNNATFPAEASDLLHHYTGALCMAGGSQNLSQFFVVQCRADSVPSVLQDQMRELGWSEDIITTYSEIGGAPYLDGSHTVFGQVLDGMDVVDAIGKTKTDDNDRPTADIILNSVTITSYHSWLAAQAAEQAAASQAQ